MATNTDIRISVSFRDHRKRKRLRSILGPEATDYLLDLWISTAMNHPTGVLEGMDELDIALEAGWDPDVKGDPSVFVSALVECKLLDRSADGTYALHDWDDHQAYAVHAPERTKKAQKAAQKRWGNAETDEQDDGSNAKDESSNATSMPGAMPKVESSNAPSPAPIPSPIPIPAPSPDPVPEGQGTGTIAPPKPDLTTEEREILGVLRTVKGGYAYDFEKDLAQVRKLAVEFPHVDILCEVKKIEAWAVDKPRTKIKSSRAFLRNWITGAKPRAAPSRQSRTVTDVYASAAAKDPDEILARLFGGARDSPGDVIDVGSLRDDPTYHEIEEVAASGQRA